MAAKIKLNLPRSLWTAQDSLKIALNTLASIKLRTSKGLDASGKPFKPSYSTNPIYVAKRGARLKPKGGRPSRTGKSIYYEGGYKQYKNQSRRRDKSAVSAEVDLVLSGNMMNNLVVKEATASGFTIGLTKHAQYGFAVNETREFIGLSPDDVEVLMDSAEAELRRKL